MSWRVAKSLDKLRTQVNVAAPNRSKTDDGTIGDEAHSSRESDHNPNEVGVVCAMDITHDPKNGVDSERLAQALRSSKDPRIKYVISNRKIWNPSISDEWRTYTGSNPHNHHVHISVKSNPDLYDNTREWGAVGAVVGQVLADETAPEVHPLLKIGSTDLPRVEAIWQLIRADEQGFGPILEAAVKAYQKKHGLESDGKVGSYTWGELLKERKS